MIDEYDNDDEDEYIHLQIDDRQIDRVRIVQSKIQSNGDTNFDYALKI